ncbi:signal peptidase [Nocardioides massiliensis]|uniref:Signal peptidase I n=1 Tax=Nocardioides massiliensis TaxID=1325935 RepID=A0ABT9NUU3_9ACTN|nr:signal peptidase I [Nocardioides massiliensis]MDP9823919.1 signal peptidase [Nocardioides massiliensis]
MRNSTHRRSTSDASRVAGFAVNTAMFLVVALAVGFLAPALMGYQRYVITSGSMTGTYDTGSVVFAEVVPTDELEVGDVITYVPPAETGITHLVTHRIVSIDNGEIRTQGDANPQVDPWTFQLADLEQPRVVAGVPYVGYLFLALADRTTRMVLIGIPAAIIALMALAELVRNVRRTPAPAVPVVATTRGDQTLAA